MTGNLWGGDGDEPPLIRAYWRGWAHAWLVAIVLSVSIWGGLRYAAGVP